MHQGTRTLVETLHLLALCRLAVRPASLETPCLLPITLLRTLWRHSQQDMPGTRARVLLLAWPATMSKRTAT